MKRLLLCCLLSLAILCVSAPLRELSAQSTSLTLAKCAIHQQLELKDNVPIMLGLGDDLQMLWSEYDSSNPAAVIAIGNTSQQIHITDVGAKATDWGRSAGTHPELAIHSNTTPTTDYLAIGNHDGTDAYLDVVGGTGLNFKVAGTAIAEVTANGVSMKVDDDGYFVGASEDAGFVWQDADADNHAAVLALGDANEVLHICNKSDIATNWNLSANAADAEVFIHSDSNPATDYLRIGAHDGTNAVFDICGASGMQLLVDGVAVLEYDDGAITGLTAANETAGAAFYAETQDGGADSGADGGHAGGLANIKTGDGGAGGAAQAGGAGGALSLITGAGGAPASGSANGGAGGAIAITSGAGGAAGAGGGTGGNGGDITVTPGAAGGAGGGSAGAAGRVILAGQVCNPGIAGTKTLYGLPVTIVFEPTTGETLTYTVPTGYDLRVLNCVGWKTAAAGDHADDQWDLKNNDGSAANIFDTEELNGIADKALCQFDNLDDGEDEVEAGDTLDLVAGEDADDDGADGIIYVYGILKTAD